MHIRALLSLAHRRRWLWLGLAGWSLAIATCTTWTTTSARAQTNNGGVITLRSDVQEANAITGVITARGNVQIDYPARQIYATSSQAQYFSEEQRIILSGNVVVLQEGNRLEAETVTYLVDEGRFVALPQPNRQVQATYFLPASDDPATPAPSGSAAGTGQGADQTQSNPEPDATLRISPVGAGTTPPSP